MAEPSILFKRLLKKHMEGVASDNEEKALLLMWNLFDDNEIVDFIEELEQDMPVKPLESKTDSAALAAAVLQKAKEKETIKQKNNRLRMVSWTAACILVVIATAILYTPQKQDVPSSIVCTNTDKGDIPTNDFYCRLNINGKQHLVIDSNYKGMLRRYGALAVILQPGVIQYKTMPYSLAADSAKTIIQQISTDHIQQYIVELPDKTRIRLNAMTAIKIYPDRLNSKEQYIELEKGEIYIEGNENANIPLVLKTQSVTLTATGSHFNTRLVPGGTLLAVETGEVTARNNAGQNSIRECSDLSLFAEIKTPKIIDTVIHYSSTQIEQITTWKQIDRVYKDADLINFVVEMAQWYGLKFTSLNCLPQKKISTSICYKATLKDFFAVLRKNGVNVYETRDGYAFCNPETNAVSAQIALVFTSRDK